MVYKHQSNWLFEWVQINQKKHHKKLKLEWKILISLVVISLLTYNFSIYNFTPNVAGWSLFVQKISNFFHPINFSSYYQQSLWTLSVRFLIDSLSYIFFGTFLSVVFALITAFFCWHKSRYWLLQWLVELLIVALWALPINFFINVFKAGYETYSYDATLLVFSWFSWLWLHKYFRGVFAGVDLKHYYYWRRQLRSGVIKSICYGIVPQIKRQVILYFFYALDSNLRWLTLLSTLGISGIGSLITLPIQTIPQQFNQIFIPLFLLLIVLLILEGLILWYEASLNRPIHTNNPTFQWYLNKSRSVNWLIVGFILLLVAMIGYSFSQLNFKLPHISRMWKQTVAYFNINWSLYQQWNSFNPIQLFLSMFSQAINVFVLGTILGFVIGLISTPKIVNKYVATCFLALNTIMRIIPTVLLFYFFNVLFISTYSVVIIILVAHYCVSFAKKVNSALRSVNPRVLTNYLRLGYGRIWILFNYLIPMIKFEIKVYFWTDFQGIFRNLVVMGVFGGGSLIGAQIAVNDLRGNSDVVGAYFFIIWLMFLLFDRIEQGWIQHMSKLIYQCLYCSYQRIVQLVIDNIRVKWIK